MEGRLDGLDAHHGNESFRLPNRTFLKIRGGTKRSNPACTERLEKRFFGDFAINRRELEMPGIFPREFPNNIECPLEVWRATGMPGRSDDDRDRGLESLANHDAEIAFGTFAWTTRFSRSQIIRPRIRGARIAA